MINLQTLVAQAELALQQRFGEIDRVSLVCTRRILEAFHRHRVSDSHFAGTVGYGYNDTGRDTLDRVMADALGTEDALVRVQFVNGTHAIACALQAAAGQSPYISLMGEPYDTLRGVLPYTAVPTLADGGADTAAITKALDAQPGAVLIQRSRGYGDRPALSPEDTDALCALVRRQAPKAVVVIDNCYCEFTGEREPAGGDMMAGSLIKNPGGGLALSGGYIAGTSVWVNRAAEALTVPGIGREAGSSLGQNRSLFQGLFMAPHTVASALKTACLSAYILENMGYTVSPRPLEPRYDIIQQIDFGDRDLLLRFVRGIQQGSPVDSFAAPEPWAMPGYDDEVVMAAGCFVQGASIELSCDGPLRPPYRAYLQGALSYEAGKLGVLTAVEAFV